MRHFLSALLIIYSFASCGPDKKSFDETDEYEIIRVSFDGYPDKNEVQPMLEDVMKRYSYTIDRDNILKVANILVTLKKMSKIGVTEMEILKHMYQKASLNDLATQAALSATILETTK